MHNHVNNTHQVNQIEAKRLHAYNDNFNPKLKYTMQSQITNKLTWHEQQAAEDTSSWGTSPQAVVTRYQNQTYM